MAVYDPNDIRQKFCDRVMIAYNQVLTALVNPFQYLTDTLADVWVLTWDGTVDDGISGAWDSFRATMNPFEQWAPVKKIGPTYGHMDAYAVGSVVGTIAGMAAQVAIASLATGGLGGIALEDADVAPGASDG